MHVLYVDVLYLKDYLKNDEKVIFFVNFVSKV